MVSIVLSVFLCISTITKFGICYFFSTYSRESLEMSADWLIVELAICYNSFPAPLMQTNIFSTASTKNMSLCI